MHGEGGLFKRMLLISVIFVADKIKILNPDLILLTVSEI